MLFLFDNSKEPYGILIIETVLDGLPIILTIKSSSAIVVLFDCCQIDRRLEHGPSLNAELL